MNQISFAKLPMCTCTRWGVFTPRMLRFCKGK